MEVYRKREPGRGDGSLVDTRGAATAQASSPGIAAGALGAAKASDPIDDATTPTALSERSGDARAPKQPGGELRLPRAAGGGGGPLLPSIMGLQLGGWALQRRVLLASPKAGGQGHWQFVCLPIWGSAFTKRSSLTRAVRLGRCFAGAGAVGSGCAGRIGGRLEVGRLDVGSHEDVLVRVA